MKLLTSEKYFLYSVVVSIFAIVINYTQGWDFTQLWFKSPFTTGLASVVGFVIPAGIALKTVKKDSKAGNSTKMHLFKMSIFEEHIFRLAAVVAIQILLSLELQAVEIGVGIALIGLIQTVLFMAIHHRISIMHVIYPLCVWLPLAWYGGLIAAVISHISANLLPRLLVEGD